MVDVNSYFAGEARFLKAADLPQPVTVRIEECGVEDVGDREKVVLRFAGLPDEIADRGLVLNKINGEILAASFGSETDAWVGRTVAVFNDPSVRGPGGIRGGLRVRRVVTGESASGCDAAESQLDEHAPSTEHDDERVPF